MKFVNKTDKTITIDKDSTKVRVMVPLGKDGPWKTFMTSNLTVKKNDSYAKGFVLKQNCGAIQKFKVKAISGKTSWWEYKTLHTSIDQTIIVRLKP